MAAGTPDKAQAAIRGRLTEQGGDGGAGEEWKWTLKADHRAAGLNIHLNFLDVQGVDGEDMAVGFALPAAPRRRSLPTKIGAGLNGLFRQLRLTGTGLAAGRGYRPAG